MYNKTNWKGEGEETRELQEDTEGAAKKGADLRGPFGLSKKQRLLRAQRGKILTWPNGIGINVPRGHLGAYNVQFSKLRHYTYTAGDIPYTLWERLSVSLT